MTFTMLALILGWLVLICYVVYARQGWSNERWTNSVVFRPAEQMSAHQLFCCLLSANLALIEHDDFNQLASRLPEKKASQLLSTLWGIDSSEKHARFVKDRLVSLGQMSAQERGAIAAWINAMPIVTEPYFSLTEMCRFLSIDQALIAPGRITSRHLNTMALDVQQTAYVVRLGLAAGYMRRDMAEKLLLSLKQEAVAHYDSWEDFSLSALICMGMRNGMEPQDPGDWQRIARTHVVLLSGRSMLIDRAAAWRKADVPMPTTVRPSVSAKSPDDPTLLPYLPKSSRQANMLTP